MEPAFFRGDLLFLTNDLSDPVRVGEVLVFKVRGQPGLFFGRNGC
jgi:signal peptidase